MRVTATKDPYEIEQEEAERLVRPSPRCKPPRRDRRRNRVKDPDEEAHKVASPRDDGFEDWVAVKTFIHPETKSRVQYHSLPPEEQKRIRSQWDGDEDTAPQDTPASAPKGEPTRPAAPKTPAEKVQLGHSLRDLFSSRPEMNARLDDLLNESSMLAGLARQNPTYPAKEIFRNEALPEGIATIQDLVDAVRAAKSTPRGAPPKKVAPPQQPPTSQVQPTAETPAAQGAPAAPGAPAPPKRPKPTDAEVKEALRSLNRTFPASLVVRYMYMHPVDIQQLVGTYKQQVARGPVLDDQWDDFVSLASQHYAVKPEAVPMPVYAKDQHGLKKAFTELSAEEQSEQYQRHKVEVVARSLANKVRLAQTFKADGAPPKMASRLAAVYLGGPKEGDALKKQVEDTFKEAVKTATAEPLRGRVRDLLLARTRSNSTAYANAVAALSATDYVEVKRKYLQGPKAVTEHADVAAIYAGVKGAMRDLDGRLEGVPARYRKLIDAPSKLIRARVLERLESVAPKKAREVQRKFDVDDADAFDVEYQHYRGAYKEYEQLHAQFEERSKAGLFRVPVAPPIPPKKPEVPPNYAAVRKFSSDMKKDYQLDSDAEFRAAVSGTTSTKTARYHGVQPASPPEYPTWKTANPVRLSPADMNEIVRVARTALKEPHLDGSTFEGLPEDVQWDVRTRAALDLAVRTAAEGKYAGGMHPQLYQQLLDRVAGNTSEPPTAHDLGSFEALKSARVDDHSISPLIEETAPKTMFKYSTKKATQILTALDWASNIIEDNYEKLQIPAKVAAEILPVLDGLADSIQLAVGGEDNFKAHVARVLKAEVLQKEPDEPYMNTFENPMQPHQVERDEPYMDAYEDDQSSSVVHGKSSTNQPLTPNYRG